MQLRARPWILVAAIGAAAVLAVGAAKGAARLTDDPVVWGLAGWVVPGDFGVFLVAGEAVRAGESPYPSGELLPPPHAYYVYPPPLALVVTPFTALPPGIASAIWTLLGIGAVLAALLLLGVRDWRCFLLVLLYPSTREALEYGAIGTFLALLVALAWRSRGRLPGSAAATAAAVSLKLFLWPLVVWHGLAGRVRTGVAAAAGATGLALATWAAIGFRGLGDYPRLLRDLTELDAHRTYSVFALARALGVPELGAQALAVALGVALLAAAYAAARRGEGGEAASLVLVLGAAFALTPILWHHYLVLLVVPLALASPRLGALWVVPLVPVVFEAIGWYGGWADGIAPRLTVLGLVAVVVAASVAALGGVGRVRPAPARGFARGPARAR